jgi:hypothetical protein
LTIERTAAPTVSDRVAAMYTETLTLTFQI